MKILSINSVPYGSTCKVMTGIAFLASKRHSTVVATGYSSHPVKIPVRYIKIGGMFNKAIHMILSEFTGYDGCFSFFNTKYFLRQVDRNRPDLIHLHNLHGWFIHIPTLFAYIKKHDIPVVWTLHDCWSFTGHCPHFTMVKCEKWKSECHNCPQYREYPESYVDASKIMYKLKKKWFAGVKDLTIVTPSQWLADLVKQSFLKEYPVVVINNGIDLSVFKPTESKFRTRYAIGDSKRIILGVAFGWGVKKGLDVFIELEKRLESDKYQIVLVGTDEKVDRLLPKSIISIHRTQNSTELAEIYTAADLFVNPTREENYPTVNMESLACGTPVVTFRTGGSPESIDLSCGSVVDCDDVDELERVIKQFADNKFDMQQTCLNVSERFAAEICFDKYIQLYDEKDECLHGRTFN